MAKRENGARQGNDTNAMRRPGRTTEQQGGSILIPPRAMRSALWAFGRAVEQNRLGPTLRLPHTLHLLSSRPGRDG